MLSCAIENNELDLGVVRLITTIIKEANQARLNSFERLEYVGKEITKALDCFYVNRGINELSLYMKDFPGRAVHIEVQRGVAPSPSPLAAADRAALADKCLMVLHEHVNLPQSDHGAVVIELLCNLMHYSNREGLDFGEQFKCAMSAYELGH